MTEPGLQFRTHGPIPLQGQSNPRDFFTAPQMTLMCGQASEPPRYTILNDKVKVWSPLRAENVQDFSELSFLCIVLEMGTWERQNKRGLLSEPGVEPLQRGGWPRAKEVAANMG